MKLIAKITVVQAYCAILILCATTSGCAFINSVIDKLPANAGFIVTADSICLSGMTGAASEACYDLKAKTAYIRYANGATERLKATGGGIVGGKLVVQLEGGGRVTIARDGSVVIEPSLPVKATK